MIIFNQALKRIFLNKTKLLVLLVMPMLFIILFAMQEERSLTIGVVDNDHSTLSQKLANDLADIHRVKVTILEEKEVYDRSVSYQIDYAIIIESGFEERLMSGEKPSIKEFYLQEKEKLFFARNFVEDFIFNLQILANGVGYHQDSFNIALKEYENGKLILTNASADNDKIPQARRAMGFLVQFMLYMSVITAGLILEDKNSGVFYRVFYAPITLKRYLAENLAAFLIVGALQVMLILGLLKLFFGMEFGSNPLNLYTLLVAFAIVCVSFGMWLVSLFKKPLGAYISIILLTTPLVMLGGCYWPMEFMPETLQRIALFIPTSWVMTGVDKILYEGKNIMGTGLELLVLLTFSGIFLAAGLIKKVDISK
ncbi:MAG: ABC transporter permease [Bacillota bacterium]|nr:ABC transporter permease [Bacillota bacterium]